MVTLSWAYNTYLITVLRHYFRNVEKFLEDGLYTSFLGLGSIYPTI